MQTINTLIFVFGTAFSVFGAIHFANIQRQKMPEHTAPRLEQFARMAVQKVEQTGPDLSPETKKSLAEKDIINLYTDYNILVPTKRAINTAIDSAMFLLPPKQ